MEYGTLKYKVALSEQKLNSLCNTAFEKALAKDDVEVNGVEVTLQKAGDVKVNVEGKAVMVQVPLDIQLRRQAGLFTVEGNGGISLSLKLNYDISKDLKLKCKAELVGHEWIEKPKLEIGALNIPVETLMNLVLNHYESVLIAKVDNAINENANLLPLVHNGIQSLEGQLNKVLPLDHEVDIKLGEMGNMTPRTLDNFVNINGQIELGLSLQNKGRVKNDQLPTVSWLTEIGTPKPIIAELELGYDEIISLLLQKLSGKEIGGKPMKITNIEINHDEMVYVNINLESPIKGSVKVELDPFYDMTAGTIVAKKLDVSVRPANIIYKMTAPIVNKFIEAKLESIFPINLQEMINEKIEKLPTSIKTEKGTISPQIKGVNIQKLVTNDKGIVGKVAIEGASLHLVID